MAATGTRPEPAQKIRRGFPPGPNSPVSISRLTWRRAIRQAQTASGKALRNPAMLR
jgi:hypothetical protein